MNNLFITEDVDELYLIEASLIGEFMKDTATDKIGEGPVKIIQGIKKNLDKMLIAVVAIIAICTALKAYLKKRKQDKEGKDDQNLSPFTKGQINKKNDDILTEAGIDSVLKNFTIMAKELTEARSDVKAAAVQAKQAEKERKQYIDYAKSIGLSVDSPQVKAKLKSMEKDTHNAYAKANATIIKCKNIFNKESDRIEKSIVAEGNPGHMKKFAEIKKQFED